MKEGQTKETITEEQLKTIARKAADIRYGSITLIIQDGVLIQIDSMEKIRVR